MSHAAGGGGVRVTASGGEGQECTPTRRTSGHTPSGDLYKLVLCVS